MTEASMFACGIGVFHLLLGLLLVIRTECMRKVFEAFPRHRGAAVVLTAICLLWSALLLVDTPLGRFEYLKKGLYVLTPLSFYLMITFMDELLAPRVLGGFLLLIGVPILGSVFLHESPWRVLISLWVYAAVIKGMVLVLSPYRFRQAITFWFAKPARIRLLQGLSVALGILFIAVGLTAFPAPVIDIPIRILVMRGGAIGDFLLTLPVFELLRERWPLACIELAGYRRTGELALRAGVIDAFHSIEDRDFARLFAWRAELSEERADWFRSFDVIVSLLHDPDLLLRNNLEEIEVKQVLCGSPLPEGGHAVDHLLQPLEQLALYGAGAEPRLDLPETEREAGRAWLDARGLSGPVCAIHPGSGSPAKNWPVDRYLALADRLADRLADGRADHRSLFICGEADIELEPALEGRAVLSGLPLSETAAVLRACNRFVGNDSGITHLAAALGLPTVALFGPTDPAVWGPRGGHVRIVHGPGGEMQDIGVQSVYDALMEPFD